MGGSFWRAAAASWVAVTALLAVTSGADARELRRSEVDAIARQEARRYVRTRAPGYGAPATDALRVGPQSRPTTQNGPGTMVVPNR